MSLRFASPEPPEERGLGGIASLVLMAAIAAIVALTLFGEPDVQLVVGVIGFVVLSGFDSQ